MRSKASGPVKWSAFALLASLLWALAVGLVSAGAMDPGWAIAAATAGTASLFAIAAVRIARMRHAKLSAEITIVSERLLRLEAAAHDGRHAPVPVDNLSAGMAADVELLSRLVGEVAEAVGDQSRAIAALRAQVEAPPQHAASPATHASPASVPPPAPEPRAADPRLAEPLAADPSPAAEAPPRLTSREDFAWAATAIMRRLGATGQDPSAASASASGPAGDQAALQALAEGRLDLHLQAAVTLPQRRTRFYEALSRLRAADDSLLQPGDFLPVLERHGSLARLDELACRRAFAVASHLAARDSSASVSCNVDASSLTDGRFLDAWEANVAEAPEAARRMVVESAALGSPSPEEARGVARLRASGAIFALDQVRELDQDWTALARRGVRFVKVDVEALFAPRYRSSLAGIVQTLARTGIQLVATRVELESRIPDLLDYDVPMAQGFAIALPRPVRPDLVSREADDGPLSAAGSGETPGAIPFREFLRRAG